MSYIDMCRKATEIQAARKPNNGDMVARYNLKHMQYETAFVPIDSASIEFGKGCPLIWLPRIEDLVEMVTDPKWGCDAHDHWLDDFYLFTQRIGGVNGNDSIQEMVLKFTMYKRYSKTWDGGQWL